MQTPVTIKKRVAKVVEKKIAPVSDVKIDTPIKKYICDKFGVYNCKIALAIVQAESGFNDQAINVNTNGSVDLGLWQISFPTHGKRITPAEALDPYKATDYAYKLYKEHGDSFESWVAFSTGRYLANY